MTGNKLESLESLTETSLTLGVEHYMPVVPLLRTTNNNMLEMTIGGFEEEQRKPHSLNVITKLILTGNQISQFATEHLPSR